MPITWSPSSTTGTACTPPSIMSSAATATLAVVFRLATGCCISCSMVSRSSTYAARSTVDFGTKYSSFITSAELNMPTSLPSRTTGR